MVEEKRGEIGIVRVPVALLTTLGLTAKSDVIPGIPGHVVIPELNARDYEADKARFTPIKLRLATEVSNESNIVRRPPDLASSG